MLGAIEGRGGGRRLRLAGALLLVARVFAGGRRDGRHLLPLSGRRHVLHTDILRSL